MAPPPQQHHHHQQSIHSYHLALSLILLLLTVYPYLFNANNVSYKVAAYSADDLYLKHSSIEQFDIIQSDDIILSKPISIRSVASDLQLSHDKEQEHLQHVKPPAHNDDIHGYNENAEQQMTTTATGGDHNEMSMNELDAIDQIGGSRKSPPLAEQQQQTQLKQEIIKKVHFSSLGRRFNLILGRPAHLITDDFTVTTLDENNTETRVPFDRNDLLVMEGLLDGEANSSAVASFSKQNKLMIAQISTGNDMIIVEPTYLHINHLQSSLEAANSSSGGNPLNSSEIYDKTMIVYRLRDHKQFQFGNNKNSKQSSSSPLFEPEKLCGALKLSESQATFGGNGGGGQFIIKNQQAIEADSNQRVTNDFAEDVFRIYKPEKPGVSASSSNGKHQRSRRGIEFLYEHSRDKTRCTLHLVADYLFYKHVGNGDLQTTINYLLALINRVNLIYLPTVWETGDDKLETFNNIGFTVQNITIHQEYTRLSGTGGRSSPSGADDSASHYNMQGNKIWAAREFLDNFSRNSPPRHYCLAHLLTYRQFDSPVLGLAYVANSRFGTIGGICSPTQQKGEMFYKHNTGISTSKGISGETLITRQADLVLAHELGHNLGAEHDSNECRPTPANGGAYLMHPYAVMGFEKNNRFLSNCSRLAIGRVVRRKASTCFVHAIDNVCGNGVVEDDEECDGGDVGHGHSDPCCDSSCKFTPGSQCSDRHSWCCSKCHIVPAGRACRPAEEFNCKQAAYCDGRSAECPAPPPVEDEQVCVGRGLCRSGECTPFCEARELISCLCNNPLDACKLCCKQSINSTCVPYDTRAPPLPDGVLCYRGVCERGRCEQPIQDVVERLWDVIEDINFTTLIKFFRDNIILVVLVASIPFWCIASHYINEFDKSIKQDVIAEIRKNRHRKAPISRSPFLPPLFIGDSSGQIGMGGSMNSTSQDEDDGHQKRNESLVPLEILEAGRVKEFFSQQRSAR